MLLVFDTETTGLMPGQICQLSYVMAGASLAAKNFFFAVESMPISSMAVHGLSKELLDTLSGGKTFADNAREIYEDFRAADVVAAHNLDFDVRFLKKELERCGIKYRPRHGMCTMYYFTKALNLPGRGGRPKAPSLRELAAYFKVTEELSSEWAEGIFGGGAGAHDARSDVATAYLCIERAIERGMLRNLMREKVANEAVEG